MVIMKYVKILILILALIHYSCNSKSKKNSTKDIKDIQIEDAGSELNIDGTWILNRVNDTLFKMSDYYGFKASQPRLIIETDEKRISGFSGCNNFGGYALITKDKISFPANIEAEQIGCETDNNWENDFFNRLRNISEYGIRGNFLIIKDTSSQKLEFLRQ